MGAHLLFGLLSPFGTLLVLLLHLNQVHHLVAQDLRLPVKNHQYSFNIIQVFIDLNIIQRNYNCLVGYTVLQPGNMESPMNMIELLW